MKGAKELLGSLGLLEIEGYKFLKSLGGGSALSSIYIKENKKIVFKFLIAPRNYIEIERFKLEFSVLKRNRCNRPYDDTQADLFIGPRTSYPLPIIKHDIKQKFSGYVSYFSYFYEEGELLSEIASSLESQDEKLMLLYRLSSGLSYFNQVGYVHRDLHPGNILLLKDYHMPVDEYQFNNPRVKFLDMGNCQKNEEVLDVLNIERDLDEAAVFQDNNRRILSSFSSMPPDFLRKGESTKNYDSWSFGVYMYQLFFNEMPFEAKQIEDVSFLLENKFFHEDYENNLNQLPINLSLILRHLLCPDGENRPSIDTIVRLFYWLVNKKMTFKNPSLFKEIIHNKGFDPYYNPIDHFY